ncbi:hypothetical protein M885DRAFT_506052 [Pelagophyceae sp. CCMP2097]|nr:hypothetical protein M885DRAFT_506052 [Pelagophyceae sp. CCMP2097]|mmetsp:Transcript_18861/g.63739  ORF Transcript_18861/g.63739 Transcript_18861/m.63739 type:complete len:155 (+) Transcript_18861:116-580(+)
MSAARVSTAASDTTAASVPLHAKRVVNGFGVKTSLLSVSHIGVDSQHREARRRAGAEGVARQAAADAHMPSKANAHMQVNYPTTIGRLQPPQNPHMASTLGKTGTAAWTRGTTHEPSFAVSQPHLAQQFRAEFVEAHATRKRHLAKSRETHITF